MSMNHLLLEFSNVGDRSMVLLPCKSTRSIRHWILGETFPLPFYPSSHIGLASSTQAVPYEDPAASAAAAAFACARFLGSPCLPPCSAMIPSVLAVRIASSRIAHCHRVCCRASLTSHLENRSSCSPRRSAASLLSSFRLRRTTRPATAR